MTNLNGKTQYSTAIMLLLMVLLTAQAKANDVDFETQLAVQIVNDYRQLRMSCNDQKDQARRMCYYRLRIGMWDYKEARKTLDEKGLRIVGGTQVATID